MSVTSYRNGPQGHGDTYAQRPEVSVTMAAVHMGVRNRDVNRDTGVHTIGL